MELQRSKETEKGGLLITNRYLYDDGQAARGTQWPKNGQKSIHNTFGTLLDAKLKPTFFCKYCPGM
jgi:hypothetical protein